MPSLRERLSSELSLKHGPDLKTLQEAIAVLAAAEALATAHLAHLRAYGRDPSLQDARNVAFEALLALFPPPDAKETP